MPLAAGDVIDSNSILLAARATQVGARAAVTGIQPDNPDMIAAEIRPAAATSDLVLLLAGSSAGCDDFAAEVLARVGALTVRGVAVRPGHPVLLGSGGAHLRPGISRQH